MGKQTSADQVSFNAAAKQALYRIIKLLTVSQKDLEAAEAFVQPNAVASRRKQLKKFNDDVEMLSQFNQLIIYVAFMRYLVKLADQRVLDDMQQTDAEEISEFINILSSHDDMRLVQFLIVNSMDRLSNYIKTLEKWMVTLTQEINQHEQAILQSRHKMQALSNKITASERIAREKLSALIDQQQAFDWQAVCIQHARGQLDVSVNMAEIQAAYLNYLKAGLTKGRTPIAPKLENKCHQQLQRQAVVNGGMTDVDHTEITPVLREQAKKISQAIIAKMNDHPQCRRIIDMVREIDQDKGAIKAEQIAMHKHEQLKAKKMALFESVDQKLKVARNVRVVLANPESTTEDKVTQLQQVMPATDAFISAMNAVCQNADAPEKQDDDRLDRFTF